MSMLISPNTLYPGTIQSATGAPAPQPAPMIPQQQLQAPTFAQRFQSNMGPILQALGYGIASNDLSRGAAMIGPLADRRREAMMQQQAMAQEQQQSNFTKQWLKAKGREDLIPLVDAGHANDALRMATQNDPNSQQPEQFGVTPVRGTDPKTGKTVLGVIGNRGSFKPLDTGAGFEVANGVDKVDLGTHFALIDKATGQTIGTMPKENYQAEFDKGKGGAEGTAAGQATVAAPKDLQAAENALSLIQDIRSDPNKAIGTGASSMFNVIPGTPGKDFQNKVDQATSGAFLTAIQAMRGMGQLSNSEGAAATQAVTRMSTATSQEAFDAALNDYEKIVRQAYARAANTMGGGQPINPNMPPAEDPLGLR